MLCLVMVALLGLGTAAALVPRRMQRGIGLSAASLAGFTALLAAILLVIGPAQRTLALPLGPPGLPLTLRIDGLSAFFLLCISLAGTACLAFATASGAIASGGAYRASTLAGGIISLGGWILALLAAEPSGLALGIALGGGGLWSTAVPGRPNAAFLAVLGLAAFTIVAAGAIPADTQPTAVGTLLALLGPGALAVLAPTVTQAMPRQAALVAGALIPVALYAELHMLTAMAEPPPAWYGMPFLLAGIAACIIGGWRAGLADSLDTAVAAFSLRQSGIAMAGSGLMLIGRATDMPSVAALAMAAVLLSVAIQSIGMTLLLLAADAVHIGAGSWRFDRLGGLLGRMPLTGGSLLTALVGIAALPPSAGFAALWLLFQAALAAPRFAGPLGPIVTVALIGGLGWSGVLMTAAGVRLFGLAFLGRPRSPRAAAADEAPRRCWPPLVALAVVSVLLGLLPGLVLSTLARSAIQQITASDLSMHIGVMGPGFAPLSVAALLGLCIGAVGWLSRPKGVAPRATPGWNDGFAAAPLWLPFGDPLTQSTGDDFVPPPPAMRPGMWRLRGWRLAPTLGMPAALAAAAILLAWFSLA